MSEAASSKATQVYNRLKRALMFQMVPPRTRLDVCYLAELLHVSNTPVREALILLADEGVIQVDPRHGYFSKPLDADALADEYEMALIILERSIETSNGHLSDTALTLPHSNIQRTGLDVDGAVASSADFIEGLFEGIAASSGNLNFSRTIKAFNGKTKFIRQLDLRQAGRLAQIGAAMGELIECLKQSDIRGAIANLERQYQGKIDLLHHLVDEGNLIALHSGGLDKL